MNYINYANTNNATTNSVCPVCAGKGIILAGLRTNSSSQPMECNKCHGTGYINLYWGGAVAA